MENKPSRKLSDREVVQYTSTLWKYKAIPKKEIIPEPAPEYLKENHTIGDFQVIAARVRGKKHKNDGSNCDDWFATENVEGIFVSAVADGAGSKKFSRIGARESCNAAVMFLKIHLEKLLKKYPALRADLSKNMATRIFSDAASLLANLIQEAAQRARAAVVNAYKCRKSYDRYKKVVGRELQLKDFSSTLLLTVAVPLPNIGEVLIIACQIGDGIIAAMNTKENFDKALTLLGVPDSGDFAGETDFLTNPAFALKENLASRTRLSRKPIDLILSMTDGVADDYYPNEVQLRRLYFDLIVNRILQLSKDEEPLSLQKSDGSKLKTSIQYTSEICETLNLTLEDIWKNRESLINIAKEIPYNRYYNSAMRLQEWLDNYTLRGSFDDRTLVILWKGGASYDQQDSKGNSDG